MKLSPDDAAASFVPPRADEGPAAPSFPGTPGRERPEDSPMPQQPPAVHDETARLGDGPVPAPPPAPPPAGAPAAHAQSPRHGQPSALVPADQPRGTRAPVDTIPADECPAEVTLVGLTAAPGAPPPAEEASAEGREWDDTRPVSREWMTADTRDTADDAPAQEAPAEQTPAEQTSAKHGPVDAAAPADAAAPVDDAAPVNDAAPVD